MPQHREARQGRAADDTALLHSLMALFRGLRQALTQELRDEAVAPGGVALAPFHLMLLRRCVAHPGLTQQDLVQFSGRDKGHIARVVRDLDDAGLLTRVPHPNDGRAQCLQPTSAALRQVQRFDAAEASVAQRAFAALAPAEREQWRRQIAACADALDPPGAPSRP